MIHELFWSYLLVMVVMWAVSSGMALVIPKDQRVDLMINSKKLWVRLIVRVPAWMLLGLPVMIIIYGMSIIWG